MENKELNFDMVNIFKQLELMNCKFDKYDLLNSNLKQNELLISKLEKYENRSKANIKRMVEWIKENRDKFNENQRTYYKKYIKGNEEFLKKKREHMHLYALKKYAEDNNYYEIRNQKAKERYRLNKEKKIESKMNELIINN